MDATPPRRRVLAVLLVGLATAGLGACATPVESPPQPPMTIPTFTGISVDASDHTVGVRDLYVLHPGDKGYAPGDVAELSLQVGNNTDKVISLVSATAAGVPVVLVGMSEQPIETFDVLVPPGQLVPLRKDVGRYLQISCMPMGAQVGDAIPMTFTFSNGTTIEVNAPVGDWPNSPRPPLTPAASDAGSCK